MLCGLSCCKELLTDCVNRLFEWPVRTCDLIELRSSVTWVELETSWTEPVCDLLRTSWTVEVLRCVVFVRWYVVRSVLSFLNLLEERLVWFELWAVLREVSEVWVDWPVSVGWCVAFLSSILPAAPNMTSLESVVVKTAPEVSESPSKVGVVVESVDDCARWLFVDRLSVLVTNDCVESRTG